MLTNLKGGRMANKKQSPDYKTALKVVAKKWNLDTSELERMAKETSEDFQSLQTCLSKSEAGAWPELSERRMNHISQCAICTSTISEKNKRDCKTFAPGISVGML